VSEYEDPKLRPEIVTSDVSVVAVLRGATALTIGLSNEKSPLRVPTAAATVIATLVLLLAIWIVGFTSAVTRHLIAVELLHEEVTHHNPPSSP
jgi:hypothetical protein